MQKCYCYELKQGTHVIHSVSEDSLPEELWAEEVVPSFIPLVRV